MDRSGITEIRKLFTYNGKEGDLCIAQHCGCLINISKEIKGVFSKKLLSEEKDTMLKFLDIHKKSLSNGNVDVVFGETDKKDGGMQFLLEKIRATELKNDAILKIFYEKTAEALPESNFVVTLSYGVYEIPVKTKDKLKVDDASDEVYSFITCSICPVKTNKGSLGYLPDKDRIGENPQLLVLDKPAFGFIYPAFNDRSADTGALSCFCTEGLNISEELFAHKVIAEKTEKPKAQPKIEKADSDIGQSLVAAMDVLPVSAAIPSLDTGTLSNNAHYVPEKDVDEPDIDLRKEDLKEAKATNLVNVQHTGKPVSIRGDRKRYRRR
ncbi:MAG: DUF4317 family protein [Lachnospiraceae bacterium]|nr:DUF4317 family protein [Lachnospiraceae bacterium]